MFVFSHIYLAWLQAFCDHCWSARVSYSLKKASSVFAQPIAERLVTFSSIFVVLPSYHFLAARARENFLLFYKCIIYIIEHYIYQLYTISLKRSKIVINIEWNVLVIQSKKARFVLTLRRVLQNRTMLHHNITVIIIILIYFKRMTISILSYRS